MCVPIKTNFVSAKSVFSQVFCILLHFISLVVCQQFAVLIEFLHQFVFTIQFWMCFNLCCVYELGTRVSQMVNLNWIIYIVYAIENGTGIRLQTLSFFLFVFFFCVHIVAISVFENCVGPKLGTWNCFGELIIIRWELGDTSTTIKWKLYTITVTKSKWFFFLLSHFNTNLEN